MKTRVSFVLVFAAVAVFFIVAGLAVSRYFLAFQTASQANEEFVRQQLAHQQKDIGESQIQIAALLAANQTVADELKSEAAKRLAAEQENRIAQGKLTQLAETVEKNKAPSISAIIKEWRPRIAAVTCVWSSETAAKVTKYGTAVLMQSGSSLSPHMLTSKHVLQNKEKLPNDCTLTFPDQEEKIKPDAEDMTISSETKYDWAKIALPTPPAYAVSLALMPALRCTETAAVGDSVIILGYPRIGSKNDITATEGIISGFENSYYITSAKVERGNSGGAAILTKQNCYLGIPTFVDAGEIESLARILDQRVIEK